MGVDHRYLCACRAPNPWIIEGVESGLCETCNYIYDEALYEMRMRQHQDDFLENETIEQYLLRKDPEYQRITSQAAPA